MTTKTTLIPTVAVIHDYGATFAYEPVGGSSIYIICGVVSQTPSAPRYHRDQESGPWGNTALIAQGQGELNEKWKPLMDEAIAESYKLVAFLEGHNKDAWLGQVIDQRKTISA